LSKAVLTGQRYHPGVNEKIDLHTGSSFSA
jgi:hypothetical protein